MDLGFKAQLAKELQDNQLFEMMFNEMREQYIKEWENSDTLEQREIVWAKYTAIGEIESYLKGIINNHTLKSYSNDQKT